MSDANRMNLKQIKRNSFMPKTVTLRLSDEDYQKFLGFAQADNRPIANAIETLALRKLEETLFVDPFEMEEILSDEDLLKRLKKGRGQAREKKGRFVD
jgi:hypothetical protein